ncbi:MAG TPA: FAD-dependent oxidoreductase [Candidatus Saccharimonadales bacterium]|nr:FAD-dependent oxidoreductase [Candidatus Saccharimonadales bacterium]
MDKKLRVVVVGGGFGGIKTALSLADDKRCSVTLVSDHSHFRYYPALYQAATGGKMAGSRIRLSNLMGESPVTFVRATIKKLDRDKKQIVANDGQTFPYDKLVLALGSVTNYFGIKGLRENSFDIKSLEEVQKFRQHLHAQFIKNGCPDLNYVIVGGGPTGIELAGALPSYLNEIMKKHEVADCKLSIKLIEAAPRLLPRSPKKISDAVFNRLKSLGIDIMLGSAVEGQTSDMLMVSGKPLVSHTVIWTAGIANNPFFKDNNFTLTDRGKVEVDQQLQAEPNIFVIGDNANTLFSGMAQTALYDGEFVSNTIKRQLSQAEPEQYTPKKPITVIPVGPHWAAVEWGTHCFTGFFGWILRMIADFVAFKDLTTVLRASKQWLLTMRDEDTDCPDCGPKK